MTIGANCSKASPHLEEEEPLLLLATLWVWGVYLIVAAALARRLDRMPNKQTTLVYFRPASLPGLTLAWPASACSCWPVRRVRLRISCETNFKSMKTTQGDRAGGNCHETPWWLAQAKNRHIPFKRAEIPSCCSCYVQIWPGVSVVQAQFYAEIIC